MKMKKIWMLLMMVLVVSMVPALVQAKTETPPKCIVDDDDPIMGPDFMKFLRIFDKIRAEYPFEITNRELLEGAMKGMLQSLDPYSDYFNEEETESFMQLLKGELKGIGVRFQPDGGFIKILSVMEDSPAEKVGMRMGDIIVSVDGKSIEGLASDIVSGMIKGEKGTKVKIGLLREGKPMEFTLIRDIIKVNPIQTKILEDGIGYIEITDFNENARDNLDKALKSMTEKKVQKVILDLRNNPGGLLEACIQMADRFLSQGFIVHIRTKKGIAESYEATPEKVNLSVVVLINEHSASASEIFAAALKENGAAKVVGMTSFGKGVVQSVISLLDRTMYKFTTFEWLSPKKQSINGKGVKPDYEVQNQTDQDGELVDFQLRKAIELLKERKR